MRRRPGRSFRKKRKVSHPGRAYGRRAKLHSKIIKGDLSFYKVKNKNEFEISQIEDLIRTIDCSNDKGRISRVDLNAGPEFMGKSPTKERKPKRPKTAVHRHRKNKTILTKKSPNK